MVRTKADSGSAASRKVVAARAPRKVLGSTTTAGPSSSGESPSGKGKYAGGNPACPRPTPDWQKGIGIFLKKSPSKPGQEKENSDPTDEEEVVEGCSGSSSAGPSSSSADLEADSDS